MKRNLEQRVSALENVVFAGDNVPVDKMGNYLGQEIMRVERKIDSLEARWRMHEQLKQELPEQEAALDGLVELGQESGDYDKPAQELTERELWLIHQAYVGGHSQLYGGNPIRWLDHTVDGKPCKVWLAEQGTPNQLQQKLDTCNTAITVAINRLGAMYKLPSYNRKHTVSSIIAKLKETRDD